MFDQHMSRDVCLSFSFFFFISTSAHLEETFRDRVHVGLTPGFSLFSHHTGHYIQTLHDKFFCFFSPSIYLNSQLRIQTYPVSPLPSQNLLDVIHYSLSMSSFSFPMSIPLFPSLKHKKTPCHCD